MWEVRLAPCGDFDNSPFESRHFNTIPLSGAMGAEIAGIRLPDLSDEAFEDFKQALYRHKTLFLRDQHLTHAEHEEFGARLGPFAVDAYTHGVEGHRNVHPIIKEADTKTPSLFGGSWHTDSPFLPEPPAITTLRSVEVPPYAGDTLWANSALAFRHLSPVYQDMLRPLRVHMSAANNQLTQAKHLGEPLSFGDKAKQEQGLRGSFHPLVRTHPETGEEALYICETYSIGIEGMTTAEAKPILDFLVAHTIQHAFCRRLRWEAGMVALWDNRLTMHLAPNDYDGFRREMYRTTTAGTVPV